MRKLTPLRVAIAIIAISVFITIAAAFGESFHGLLIWAAGHGLTGGSAAVFPLIIDTFIITGETALFIANHEHWNWPVKALGWFSVIGGLTISVLFNTGRVHTTDWTTHFTDAIPPAAAAIALMIALAVFKRMKRSKDGKTEIKNTAPEKPVAPDSVIRPVPVPKPGPRLRAVVKATAKKDKLTELVMVDPGIKTNTLATQVGISWATADKWRKEVHTRMEN